MCSDEPPPDGAGGGSLGERVARVSDPVAFMGRASYNAAYEDPTSEDGFYGQARAECASLIGAFEGSAMLPHAEATVAYLTALDQVYADIVATTEVPRSELRSSTVREEMADAVIQGVDQAHGALSEIQPEDLGEEHHERALQSMKDFRLFMMAWPAASARSDDTDADPKLCMNFLQTFERYRQILNYYGELEARGGDEENTKTTRVKKGDGYHANTSEDLDQAAQDHGGHMVLALKSYGSEAERIQQYGQQIAEVVVRLLDGEFDADNVEEEFIEALRSHVGGGQASERFYQRVIDGIVEAGLQTWLAKEHAGLLEEAMVDLKSLGIASGKAIEDTQESFGEAKKHAKSKEDNYDLDQGVDELLQHEDSRKVYWKGYGEAYDDPTEIRERQTTVEYGGRYGGTMPVDVGPRTDRGYDQATYERVHIQNMKSADASGEAAAEEYVLTEKLSPQEVGIRNVDQEGADHALKKALEKKDETDRSFKKAKALHEQTTEANAKVETLFLQTVYYNTQAKKYTKAIDDEAMPELRVAKQKLLSEQEAIDGAVVRLHSEYKKLKAYHKELDNLVEQLDKDLRAYDPERLKVPKPTATVDGIELRQERYDTIKLELSFPIPAVPVLSVFGYVEGTSGQSTDMEGGDLWSMARIEAGGGVRADLWLVQAALTVAGFFEAEVRGDANPAEVIQRGTEELMRWVYAWWYEARPVGPKLLAAAAEANSGVHDVLDTAEKKLGTGDFDRFVSEGAETALMEAIAPVAGALVKMGFSGGSSEVMGALSGLIDADIVRDRLAELQGVDQEEARAALEELRGDYIGSYQMGYADLESTLDDSDPGKNDPDVKFTAGVSISASASFGSPKAAQLSASSSSTFTIRDGEGEGYDTSVQNTRSRKLTASIAGGEASVGDSTMMSTSGDLEQSILGELVLPLGSAPDDVSLIADLLRNRVVEIAQGGLNHRSAGEMLDSLEGVNWKSLLSLGGIRSNLSLRVKVDLTSNARTGNVSGKLTVGIEQGRDQSFGVAGLTANVEMTSGYQVVLDF